MSYFLFFVSSISSVSFSLLANSLFSLLANNCCVKLNSDLGHRNVHSWVGIEITLPEHCLSRPDSCSSLSLPLLYCCCTIVRRRTTNEYIYVISMRDIQTVLGNRVRPIFAVQRYVHYCLAEKIVANFETISSGGV